jgi:hypothetical protein
LETPLKRWRDSVLQYPYEISIDLILRKMSNDEGDDIRTWRHWSWNSGSYSSRTCGLLHTPWTRIFWNLITAKWEDRSWGARIPNKPTSLLLDKPDYTQFAVPCGFVQFVKCSTRWLPATYTGRLPWWRSSDWVPCLGSLCVCCHLQRRFVIAEFFTSCRGFRSIIPILTLFI